MSFANEFRIHGNLVNDVRRGRTGGGVTTAFYVVAVDHQFRSGDNIQTTTDFIPITTYGKQAERPQVSRQGERGGDAWPHPQLVRQRKAARRLLL